MNSSERERALRIPIADVASALSIKLRKEGLWYKALCPFHRERTGSFALNIQKNQYVCFGCRVSGNVIDLVINVKQVTFKEALSFILALGSQPIDPARLMKETSKPSSPLRKAILSYTWSLYKDPYGTGLAYLNNRGISSTALTYLPVKYHHDPKQIGKILQHEYKLEDLYESGLFVESKYGPYYLLEKYPVLSHRFGATN